MLVQVSTYTGNGADSRAITGVGFEPSLVIIKGDTTQKAVWRTTSMSGDNATTFASEPLASNYIQSLDSDGFTIGTDAIVNSNGITYYYIAIRRETNDPDFNYGSYIGDGTDDRNITGIGFQPTLVLTKSGGARAIFRDNNDSGTTSHRLDTTTSNNLIQALQSDGFQVGTSANINGTTYYWFAFRAVTRRIVTGTYTGNATDNRNITGLGFQPNWVWIIDSTSGSASDEGIFRTNSFSGDASVGFFQARAITTNLIQALQSDGFQIGTHDNVNTNNEPYQWFALANTSTSTSTSTTTSTSSSTSTTTTTSTSSSTSTSTTSTSSSTTTSTSTTTTLTSTSTSTTSTSTSTTSTSTSTTTTTSTSSSTSTTSTSSSTSITTSTSSSTSTTSTSTSTTTTFPFHIKAGAVR